MYNKKEYMRKYQRNYYHTHKKQYHDRLRKWKHEQRLKAITYLGGKCVKCGYNKYMEVLEFHHKDPNIKEKNLSQLWWRSWVKIKREIEKCELLCANCHREVHVEWRE